MNAEQLSLGNWVYADDKPLCVKAISRYTITLSCGGETLNYHPRYLQPIPITEDILIANDFKPLPIRGSDEWRKFRRDGIEIHHITSYYFRTERYSTQFKCVHEMQNLITLLTGKQIEITLLNNREE